MQILINGLITGLTLAVLALFYGSLSATAGVLSGIGGIYSVVPFVAWAMIQAGLPWYVASILAIGTGIGISLLCEWLNHVRLEQQRVDLGRGCVGCCAGCW